MASQKIAKGKTQLKQLSLVVLLLVLCCSTTAFAQQSDQQLISSNLGFVSPNTRENLNLKEAVHELSSAEEFQLTRQARSLTCVIRRPIRTSRGVGTWSDGAEHSVMIRVQTDEATMRYLMSRLGRSANQKAVLYFHPQRNGSATIYIIHPSRRFRSFAAISRLLDSSGVAFRTLVPTQREMTVYVIDLNNTLSAKVRSATQRLRGRLNSLTGSASFIGDDSARDKGQEIFQQEIRLFENKHPNLPPPCTSN